MLDIEAHLQPLHAKERERGEIIQDMGPVVLQGNRQSDSGLQRGNYNVNVTSISINK